VSVWDLRWHFTNRSITWAPYSIKVTVCHTAGHCGEEYDDWNNAVFMSRRNCSSDGAERTDVGRAFHARAAATGKARSPSVVRSVDITTSINVEALQRRQHGHTLAVRQSVPLLWPQVREQLCQQGGTCQRTTHTVNLTECGKTRSNDCSDVSTHGDVCVNINLQVSNYSFRQHRYVTNTNTTSRDLMLTSSRWIPEHLSLGSVKLQPVGHHLGENSINADRQTLLQCVNIRRVRKPVDLIIVCIAVWMEMDTMSLHQLQQVSNVKEEEDWSEDRTLWHSK